MFKVAIADRRQQTVFDRSGSCRPQALHLQRERFGSPGGRGILPFASIDLSAIEPFWLQIAPRKRLTGLAFSGHIDSVRNRKGAAWIPKSPGAT